MSDAETINNLLGIIDENVKKIAEQKDRIDALNCVIDKLKETIVILEEQNDKN